MSDWQAELETFKASAPGVYERFVSLATVRIQNGETRLSARELFHVMRRERGKLNDHLSPDCVRFFDLEYPQHVGVFEKRPAKIDAQLRQDKRQMDLFWMAHV